MATPVDQKLLKSTKFPPEFSRKVDMTKVNIEVMKKWIASRISEILGDEDDIVIELCFNLLEGSRYPNVKELQIQLTGFLDKDTSKFCKELWSLCLSGQENPQGVPKELLEAKKLELMQEKAGAAVVEAVTLADETSQGHHLPETEAEAVIDTVNPHLAATSILTSRLAPAEADQSVLPPTHVLQTAHDPAPLVDPGMTVAGPALGPHGEAAEKKRDAARTTVIAIDPIPVIHHAHLLPDETEADRVPSPAA
ncbi:hypothetical protein N7523_008193 [Penicillium sp. IBT 18751x]|nr:hypothetical protein N7523_008193 [Penicillium sp. IBT 18751x]